MAMIHFGGVTQKNIGNAWLTDSRVHLPRYLVDAYVSYPEGQHHSHTIYDNKYIFIKYLIKEKCSPPDSQLNPVGREGFWIYSTFWS